MRHKPPEGVPRCCWNHWDGKRKFQYDTVEEAREHIKREDYHAYLCNYCGKFHTGKLITRFYRDSVSRSEELVIELGIRAAVQVYKGDTFHSVQKSARAALRRREMQRVEDSRTLTLEERLKLFKIQKEGTREE